MQRKWDNHHAIPQDLLKQMEEEKSKEKKQTKIDNILDKSTAPCEFTCEGVLHAVAQFVACDDQVWVLLLYWCVFVVLMIREGVGRCRKRSISKLISCYETESSP